MASVVVAVADAASAAARPAPGVAVPGRAARRFLPWLAVIASGWAAAAFVLEQAARAMLPSLTLEGPLGLADGVTLLLALALGVGMWLARRDDAGVLLAATLAPLLLAVRLIGLQVLGLLELATLREVAADGLALLALGVLVWTATASWSLRHAAAVPRDPAMGLFTRVVDVAACVVLAAGLSGVVVRAVGAGWACDGTVVCRLGLDALSDIQAYHRLLAYVAVGLAAWLAVEAFRTQRGLRLAVPLSLVLAGVIGAEALIGLGSVWLGVPDLGQALHAAASTAAWTCAVALLVAVHRPRPAVVVDARGAGTLGAEAVVPRSTLRLVAAYVQLTKPRVMSLLLATTAAAMVIAARGMPQMGLLVATLLGGALMSGGAGAINHYVDRDIDPLMGRTAWRPIPSGVIAPARALAFGIALSVLATVVFLVFTNPLATLFALLGLLGYVFIYTLWLKRSTPSNIVIGGAAGAIPPLVGWAAVTGEVSSLTAWYLFAIIFFWTPPHFWALSLLIRKHYERAGVPMLPVVRGEDETRRQIVLYSCLLVALSLVLSPFGLMGLVYFASAIVLGGLFIAWAVRLWREATPQAARRLYLYSILYLFALFVAMAVDRSL